MDRSTLTLQEKASLTSGADFWWTKPVERAGVPAIRVADGPHGLRKQVVEEGDAEVGQSVPATCFPTAAALASMWDPELLHRVGEAVSRLSGELTDAHPEVARRQMKGMRNVVAHQYGFIDYRIVWRALTDDLPRDVEHISEILDSVT